MRTIAAAQFQQRCLTLLDNVDPDGIVITKNGRPVARLLPVAPPMADLIGSMKDKLRIHTDLLATDEDASLVHNVPLRTRDAKIRRSKVVPIAK